MKMRAVPRGWGCGRGRSAGTPPRHPAPPPNQTCARIAPPDRLHQGLVRAQTPNRLECACAEHTNSPREWAGPTRDDGAAETRVYNYLSPPPRRNVMGVARGTSTRGRTHARCAKTRPPRARRSRAQSAPPRVPRCRSAHPTSASCACARCSACPDSCPRCRAAGARRGAATRRRCGTPRHARGTPPERRGTRGP